MNNKIVALDAGHGSIKAKRAAGAEIEYPHALLQLTESKYQSIIKRYGNGKGEIPHDYIRVNDVPYAVGAAAERHGQPAKRTGAARYIPEYYGVLAIAALTRLYDQSCELSVFASHPPGDVEYAEQLMRSVLGVWDVEAKGKRLQYKVSYTDVFDEPAGGFYNILLTSNGTHYQKTELKEGRFLVLDIGAITTDFIIIEDGDIDYGLAHTEQIGITQVVDNFVSDFRSQHMSLVAGANLSVSEIRRAIVTGEFRGGGETLDCVEIASEARNLVLNRIRDIIQSRMGGGFNYQGIILTGGGSALLYNDFTEDTVNNKNIMLADDVESMQFANVRGGLKLWRLLEFIGA